jgi:hypothetical protein
VNILTITVAPVYSIDRKYYEAHIHLTDTFHSNFPTTIIFFNNVHTEEYKTISRIKTFLLRTFSKIPSELNMFQYNTQSNFQEISGGGKKYILYSYVDSNKVCNVAMTVARQINMNIKIVNIPVFLHK